MEAEIDLQKFIEEERSRGWDISYMSQAQLLEYYQNLMRGRTSEENVANALKELPYIAEVVFADPWEDRLGTDIKVELTDSPSELLERINVQVKSSPGGIDKYRQTFARIHHLLEENAIDEGLLKCKIVLLNGQRTPGEIRSNFEAGVQQIRDYYLWNEVDHANNLFFGEGKRPKEIRAIEFKGRDITKDGIMVARGGVLFHEFSRYLIKGEKPLVVHNLYGDLNEARMGLRALREIFGYFFTFHINSLEKEKPTFLREVIKEWDLREFTFDSIPWLDQSKLSPKHPRVRLREKPSRRSHD